MPKRSLFVLLLITVFCSARAQTGEHAKPAKKAIHKKTIVTKTIIINDEDENDDNFVPADDEADEDEIQGDGSYVIVVDEDDDDNAVADDDAANDDMPAAKTSVHKTVRHTTAAHKGRHIYSSKYPKKLYYYNPKTGYYYKRRVPLKS